MAAPDPGKNLLFFATAWVAIAVFSGLMAYLGVDHARRLAALSPRTVAELQSVLDYSLAEVRRHNRPVPRVYLTALPEDFPDMADAHARKRTFIAAVLPLALAVNEAIAADRARLLKLKAKHDAGRSWSRTEQRWLISLARRYDLPSLDLGLLVRRVDVIPPSLAIAQAGIESGWGSSRFAQDGNALYGQRLWRPRGMIPDRRRPGERHRVRAFRHLIDAVDAYALNLNTHRTYIDLRRRRAAFRAHGRTPTGIDLAPTLVTYSERSALYVADLFAVIQTNDLGAYDAAKLDLGAALAVR